MKVRRTILFLLCLLALATAWFFWPRASRPAREQTNLISSAPPVSTSAPAATNTETVAENSGRPSAASTNRFAFRLANTPRTIDQLMLQPHAILLENAFLDTEAKFNLSIPQHLRATGEPGAYIVQARGQIDAGFRALLASSGAEVISYIPNNAYLVQLSGAGANLLAGNPGVQAVLPYEPYYKVQSSLLSLAVNQKALPDGTFLTLGIYNRGAEQTLAQIEKLGGEILTQDRSPFGKMVRVRPPADWISLAQLPGVHLVEPAHRRVAANDLTRVALGVAVNTVTNANYLNLSGSNVLVEVNDSGIDTNHPDLQGRVFYGFADSGVDTLGHGTHVAGIIAGNGSKSFTINGTNAPSGSVTNANFRGKAPLARLYSVGFLGANDTNVFVNDSYLQEAPALTNALISNNSWANGGDFQYDLSAASFDAAVRDALPQQTGPQPVAFVFAAGNDGNGNNSGSGGDSDSVTSPGTAKNVITVGALEQFRNITNKVVAFDKTTNAVWQPMTDSSSQVAFYSARGNVGVQTEGVYGRFKPDVIAPGTFVVSARSGQWDEIAYYNPTNYHFNYDNSGQVIDTNFFGVYSLPVPTNAVGVVLKVVPNFLSTGTFPQLAFYLSASNPNIDPANAATYDFKITNNTVSIPPDGGGGYLQTLIANGGVNFLVVDTTNVPVNYDLITEVITTNDNGNYFQVLSNLNQTLAPYYRYETGTSMAAPAVSGVLALMQDFFTNTLHLTPSPALLKAMLINGARGTGNYKFAVTNSINFQGWGQVNLPNSIPAALTNTAATTNTPLFFVDQNATNALATGDRRTYNVTLPTAAQSVPFRVTLAWTDPPGNPAAAIKLVNNLDLIVTNLSNGRIYYGNTFATSGNPPFSTQVSSNATFDAINNVENVYLTPPLGTNIAVTIVARSVNVNAVTTEQTNIVQDYALVISSGDGSNPNGFSVSAATPAPVPSIAPQITVVNSTNGIYFNQLAGANAPLLSTNFLMFGTNAVYGGTNAIYGTNAVVYLGQTNQWHFYVVTNTTSFTNAAFIVFLPNTKATPREGVFSSFNQNYTRPEADLDLYVASEASLTNLDPVAFSNCVFGVNGDASALSRGGTEFVAYTNATQGQVYYVGVKCEDQMAGDYGFLSVFSQEPFSVLNKDGSQTVNGLLLPAPIPDGNNAHAGVAYVFGLALYPMEVRKVVVTNSIIHQNFGDLLGALSHNGFSAILNNHDALGNGTVTRVYDDSGEATNTVNTFQSDGPGTLRNFQGTQAVGPWLLTEIDDSQGAVGTITNFSLRIEPHRDLRNNSFSTITIPAGGWFFDFLDVPVGYTNLVVVATNLPPVSVPPIQLYLNYGIEPGFSNFLARADLTNGFPPGNSISYGPPLAPGRYFVGLFNPDSVSHDVLLGASLAFNASAITTINYASIGPLALLDDAVTTDSISVTNTDLIQGFNVGLRVDHPRISDLVFHLISPNGTRYLLMENRGNTSTNGAGITVVTTNIVNKVANGGAAADTNSFDIGITSGTFPITYNFYTQPDQMTVYYGTNITPANLIYDTGLTNNPSLGGGPQNTAPVTINVTFPPPGVPANSTFLTIIINQYGNGATADAWTYTAGGILTNYEYLTFTEDTNRTLTPIKFAAPPFVSVLRTNITVQTNIIFLTNSSTLSLSSFETAAEGEYTAASTVDGWMVNSAQVSVANDTTNAQAGSKFLALASSSISRALPTVIGGTNILQFTYRGPGIAAWWRGENNANESVNANNGTVSGGVGYTSEVVNQGFNFDGTSGYIPVPASASLNVGTGGGITIEAWNNPNYDSSSAIPIFEYDSASIIGVHLWDEGNHTLYANLRDTANSDHQIQSAANAITTNVFQHVAVTYNQTTGLAFLYINGIQVATQNFGSFIPQTSYPLYLGKRLIGPGAGSVYAGLLDEISLYQRALSASEIKAIYQAGSLGKFDPAASIPSNLAKARVSLAGFSTNVLFGNNINWQTNIISFVASTTATSLTLEGLEPGMLLDSFILTSPVAVTNVVTNTVVDIGNLYYLPEQSLSPLIGTSPYGEWQLEVLDNRAGATNATLVSWQLQFIFANTNIPFASTPVTNGVASTNTLAAGGLAWFTVNVPTNADFATNILLFATNLPVNLLFSTNAPPTTTNVNDRVLFNNVNSGTIVFGTNTLNSPTNLIPGRTYYLGVQNTNATAITFALEVDFHLNFPSSPILPAISNQVIIAGTTLVVTNTATDTNAGILFYNLFTSPPTSASIFTNGVITWATSTNQPGSTNLFTTIVGNASTGRRATNFFTVTVLPLLFTNQPQTNVVFAGSLNWLVVNVPTNADFATNILLFATNLPVNLLFTTNFPPATNVASVLLLNATNGFSVLNTNSPPTNFVPGGVYYLGIQNTNAFDVTYGVEVDFHYLVPPTPPMFVGISNQVVVAGTTLVVTNLATDTNAGTLFYTLTTAPITGAVISTNGVIIWPVPTNSSAANILFTTVVSNSFTTLRATNAFTVTVLPLLFTNQPQTNVVFAGSLNWYAVKVPINADYATNILIFATNLPVNLLFTTNFPPATNGAFTLMSNATNGFSVLSTNSTPTNIVPGNVYYLGVQNTNAFDVTFGLTVNFHLLAVTNPIVISSIVATNGGYLLTWFAPSNDLFQVQWTGSLAPASWTTFTNIISYNTNAFSTPANTQFNFFDDGSQYPFGPTRFYRLLLFGSATNNSLTFLPPSPTNFTVNAGTSVVVTNAAIDSRTNAILTYSLANPPTGAVINNSGIINWVASPAGISARFNTVVTDDSSPPLTASNTFTIFVAPLPGITNAIVTSTNVTLQWSAPTNDQFQVQWTPGLAPAVWNNFPPIITSASGFFSFMDTNSTLTMKFYRLLLLP